jgi:hypothetical protein
VQPDEPRAEPPVQLPLWADEPPEEAGPLLDMIHRLRLQAWADANALRDTAAASTVRSQLQRVAVRMEMRFELSAPAPPDFTRDNYSALQDSIQALISKPEELAEVEQAVEAASADPESRKLVARITERLPSRAQVAKLTPWAVFVLVSLDMLKVAPDINPNDMVVLTMILMVMLYLLPPRSGS